MLLKKDQFDVHVEAHNYVIMWGVTTAYKNMQLSRPTSWRKQESQDCCALISRRTHALLLCSAVETDSIILL